MTKRTKYLSELESLGKESAIEGVIVSLIDDEEGMDALARGLDDYCKHEIMDPEAHHWYVGVATMLVKEAYLAMFKKYPEKAKPFNRSLPAPDTTSVKERYGWYTDNKTPAEFKELLVKYGRNPKAIKIIEDSILPKRNYSLGNHGNGITSVLKEIIASGTPATPKVNPPKNQKRGLRM